MIRKSRTKKLNVDSVPIFAVDLDTSKKSNLSTSPTSPDPEWYNTMLSKNPSSKIYNATNLADYYVKVDTLNTYILFECMDPKQCYKSELWGNKRSLDFNTAVFTPKRRSTKPQNVRIKSKGAGRSRSNDRTEIVGMKKQ